MCQALFSTFFLRSFFLSLFGIVTPVCIYPVMIARIKVMDPRADGYFRDHHGVYQDKYTPVLISRRMYPIVTACNPQPVSNPKSLRSENRVKCC